MRKKLSSPSLSHGSVSDSTTMLSPPTSLRVILKRRWTSWSSRPFFTGGAVKERRKAASPVSVGTREALTAETTSG